VKAKIQEQNIKDIQQVLLDKLTVLCEEHDYLAAELYLGLKLVISQIKTVLGPETIEQIDSNCLIVDWATHNKLPC